MNRTLSFLCATTTAMALLHGCGSSPVTSAAIDAPDGGGGGDGSAADASAAAADAGTEVAAPTVSKLMFLLRVPLATGILIREGNTSYIGRGAFDSRCRTEAAANALTGTFVAWMSASSASDADAIDRLNDGISWYLPQARGGAAFAPTDLVFESKAAIPAGPRVAITRGADGAAVSVNGATEHAWTGTDRNGHAVAGQLCDDWSADTGTGGWGTIGAVGPTLWTDTGTASCGAANRVICFQQ